MRYHTGIPNINLGRLKVAMNGLLITPGGERGRELYGLEMSPHKSQLVACGANVVVAAVCNASIASDVAADVGVAAVNDVVVVVGATAVVSIWVQRCLMRPCTSLQFVFVSVVVTPTGKELSWWDR